MYSVIRRFLAITGSFMIGLLTVFAASPAAAAVPDVWAFAYNDNLTPAPGSIMNPAFQSGSFKTVCPGSMATITQIATGKYVVNFPCSASSNGIVHVTAVDDNARYCEIENWTDAGSAKTVTVLCFKGSNRDNSKFTVTYTRSSGSTGSRAHAYVYSDPGGALLASYNSLGPANTVAHLGTGRWEVKIPAAPIAISSYDGDLQTTAVHPNDAPRRCQIDNWYISGTDYRVQISCTDPSGVLTDTWFTVSHHFKRSVFGKPPGAIAYMTNLIGAPASSDYNSVAPPNSFVNTSPGQYTISYPGVGIGATHIQVTALGGPYGYYCQPKDTWTISGGNVNARVICFNNVGVATNNLLFSTFSSDL
jgi:hypothetical protein